MNGDLLAAVALASHGTVWLRRAEGVSAPDLERTSPLFQLVRSVTFQPSGVVGVGPWLISLRERHTDRIWLVVHEDAPPALPSHLAAAFAGGGAWLLLATGPDLVEAWTSMWDVGDPERWRQPRGCSAAWDRGTTWASPPAESTTSTRQ